MDGLISAPYQNGRHGTVIRCNESRKKYVVQLDSYYMSGPQERFQAKAKNLLPVDRSEEDRIRLLLYENDATHGCFTTTKIPQEQQKAPSSLNCLRGLPLSGINKVPKDSVYGRLPRSPYLPRLTLGRVVL